MAGLKTGVSDWAVVEDDNVVVMLGHQLQAGMTQRTAYTQSRVQCPRRVASETVPGLLTARSVETRTTRAPRHTETPLLAFIVDLLPRL